MQDHVVAEVEGLALAAENLFLEIEAVSRDGPGITRSAYGPIETKAGEILQRFALSEGLVAGTDAVGNFTYDLPGKDDDHLVVMGSHLDSVPRGGNFDGLAGVVAGVIVQAACRRAGVQPPFRFRTFGFRGEESPWFGTAYLGSKLALGLLRSDELQAMTHVITGQSLAHHLQEIGATANDNEIQSARLHASSIKAYFELHIEQGPVLEDMGVPIGLATAIRGNIRHPFARCIGEYSHSSGSPRSVRCDAVTATSNLVVAVDEYWVNALNRGGNDDLIANFGIFSTNPKEHAMTKVPGEVDFSFVLAGTNNDVLQQFYDYARARAQDIEARYRVSFDFGKKVGTEAVALDQQLLSEALAIAKSLGLAAHCMPTVGHDAAMFAKLGVPSGMVLVRNQHGSHNSQESMEISDFIDACKLLALNALRV